MDHLDKPLLHYSRLALTYNSFWRHSDEFMDRMTSAIMRAARLVSEDSVVDLGGGTGLFGRELYWRTPLRNPVVCVDPCQEMLDQILPDGSVIGLHADEERFALGAHEEGGLYDLILIKEAIHHFRDPYKSVQCLKERLAPGGRILVVIVPREIEYPLFRKALRSFRVGHPDPQTIADAMLQSGMETEVTNFTYLHAIPKAQYIEMVSNRYMSLLSRFDDAELAQGIQEIEQTHPESILKYRDTYLLVMGRNA